MSVYSLLNLQSPKLSLLPSSPLSLFSQSHSLSLPRKLKAFPAISPNSLSSSFQFSSESQSYNNQDAEFEEEHVIGDCLVFEEGAFEDPYFQENLSSTVNESKSTRKAEVKPENLIPPEWEETQAEINITKKQRRRLAQQLEYGQKLEKKRQGMRPIETVNMEDYLKTRDDKLKQLKPLVLDNPSFPKGDEGDIGNKGVQGASDFEERETEVLSSSSRVAPRDPRLAVYGGTLVDISEFFNRGIYNPNAAKKSEGPRKLLTKEEKVLLNKRIPDLEVATSAKWQPLHTLAASGEFYLVNALLKHGADINVPDKDGLTAIHKAILCKKQAVFNYLLRESTNPFVRDKDGATLMHYAVRTASSQMIKILLLYNVDINLPDNDGWTPLHLAVQSRRTDVVKLLLIKGACKTLKNRDGLTPLELCLYSGQDTRTYELIKLLKQFPKPKLIQGQT